MKKAFQLNCRGQLYDFDKPVVMGILNITPDSFYQKNPGNLMEYVQNMINDGAGIIDIGGQSTRPGARLISEKEESERVLPVIKMLVSRFPDTLFSIDTFYTGIAEAAVNEGVSIINDVSAGTMDKGMFEKVAQSGVPYILMHMKGIPASTQKTPVYNNVVGEVFHFLSEKLAVLRKLGVKDIIVDPGFGFGKLTVHNFSLLKNLAVFAELGCPVMVGISRKKMIQNSTGTDAGGALNGTTAANTIALMNGASILRVHDVRAAVEAVNIYSAVYHLKSGTGELLTNG